MLVSDWLRWVFQAVTTARLRSFLTALGISIGIAAVTLLTSIGEGIRVYLMDSFSQFGTRIIAVTPGKVSTGGMAGLLTTIRPLSLDDARQLGRLPHVDAVVPILQGTAKIEAGKYSRDTDVIGVGPDMARAWRFKVAQGRFLPAGDLENSRYFTVIGSRVRQELFRASNPLGNYVRVGGTRFRVIGVMETKGQLLGFDLDDAIYIPADLAMQMFNKNSLMEIDIVFKETTTSNDMSDRVKDMLIRRHGDEDFTLFTQEDMLSTLDNIMSMLKMAVGALGGVALVVGGVGVLTIMTTALKERTQEIGLLRAVGCTRRQILWMFLGEAVLLSGLGGLLGVSIVAILVISLNTFVPGLPIALQPAYLLASLALSCGVGLAAGISPAMHAAGLDPIEALPLRMTEPTPTQGTFKLRDGVSSQLIIAFAPLTTDLSTSQPCGGNPCMLLMTDNTPDAPPRPMDGLTVCQSWLATDSDKPVIDVRCYSPTGRAIQCCGHGLLAAAYRWQTHLQTTEVSLRMNNSLIPSWHEHGTIWLGFKRLPTHACPVPDWVADVFPAQSPPIAAATCGDEQRYLILQWPDDYNLTQLAQPLDCLSRYSQRALICTSAHPSAGIDAIQLRYFAPQYGVPEDTATGSAMRVLASYWSPRFNSLTAHQCSPVGGLLQARLTPDYTHIGGHCRNGD